GAHEQRFEPRQQEEDERGGAVENADALMVHGGKPRQHATLNPHGRREGGMNGHHAPRTCNAGPSSGPCQRPAALAGMLSFASNCSPPASRVPTQDSSSSMRSSLVSNFHLLRDSVNGFRLRHIEAAGG